MIFNESDTVFPKRHSILDKKKFMLQFERNRDKLSAQLGEIKKRCQMLYWTNTDDESECY